MPARPGSGPKRRLDLSNLYTPDGLLGDGDSNLIAERIDAVLSPALPYNGTLDLAARLGLESTGLSVPIVRLPEDIEDAGAEPTLVLIGQHPLLEEETIPPTDLAPGEGLISVVPKAFGPKGAVVVSGGDDAGIERALEQIAERFPHVWERGKDRTTLDDIEMDLWRFFTGRSPEGQASIALYKLDQIVRALRDEDLRSATVLVSMEKPPEALADVVRTRARGLGTAELDVVLDNRDVQNAAVIFEESFEVASEVDSFWRLFRERVLPEVASGSTVSLEARLSEPPEIRAAITERVEEELRAAGAVELDVHVISAYKQGYSWLYDVVRPRLENESVDAITIRFARYGAPAEWKQQAMKTPLRWLQEAFPIDEILARELSLDQSRIRFEAMPEDAPPYEVVATDASGNELMRESFAPKMVLRPYIDRFRDYEMVNVTTGWIHASVNGEAAVDQRIITDAERFWDHYQETTLPRIYDYVMERHDGNPRGAGKDAPYFGELDVRVELERAGLRAQPRP